MKSTQLLVLRLMSWLLSTSCALKPGAIRARAYVYVSFILIHQLYLRRLSQNLAYSYIRRSVPHLDTVTVQVVKDMVPWFGLDGNQVELRGSAASKKWEELSWKPRIKASMDEIMAPDVITWMDVNGVTTSDQYASRALDDIRERFMKYACCIQTAYLC